MNTQTSDILAFLVARADLLGLSRAQVATLEAHIAEHERLRAFEAKILRAAKRNGLKGGRKPWKDDAVNRRRREARKRTVICTKST